jgi:hypothetical protein
LAEKSAADKLVEERRLTKELLGYRLRALEYRLWEAKEHSCYEFEGDVKDKAWESTKKLIKETEDCIRKRLTESEAALFYVARSAPIKEILDDPYDGQKRMDWIWHVNSITAKRDALVEIIKRFG